MGHPHIPFSPTEDLLGILLESGSMKVRELGPTPVPTLFQNLSLCHAKGPHLDLQRDGAISLRVDLAFPTCVMRSWRVWSGWAGNPSYLLRWPFLDWVTS